VAAVWQQSATNGDALSTSQQIERLSDEGYRSDGEALIVLAKSGRPQSRRNALRAWHGRNERVEKLREALALAVGSMLL
jgi:hypothetical protein